MHEQWAVVMHVYNPHDQESEASRFSVSLRPACWRPELVIGQPRLHKVSVLSRETKQEETVFTMCNVALMHVHCGVVELG